MWVHVTAPERPSWMSGGTPARTSVNIPPPGQIVHGTKEAASRAFDRAADFAGHQFQHLDIGHAASNAAYNASCYARRRPDVAAGVVAGAAMLVGFLTGWLVKSLSCRGKHVRTDEPPVVEYYTTSGAGVSGGAEGVDS